MGGEPRRSPDMGSSRCRLACDSFPPIPEVAAKRYWAGMTRFVSFTLSIIGGVLVAEALERFAGLPWLLARCLGGGAAIGLYVTLHSRLVRRSQG